MENRKTEIRFFTIADYEEEEAWLRRQHQNGWKLVRIALPCFYVFEECMPEDMAYRLDYTNDAEGSGHFQIFEDYGWESVGRFAGWLYLRKPVSAADPEQDGEIFSDNKARLDMIDLVVKTRFLPILILLVCVLIPNLVGCIQARGPLATALTAVFSALALLYLYLVVYCGLKLQKLREKYGNG